jgi:hypothetical protein
MLHEVVDGHELLNAVHIDLDVEGALNSYDDLNPVERIGLDLCSVPSIDS